MGYDEMEHGAELIKRIAREDWIKRNGIAIAIASAFTVSVIGSCCITGSIVRVNTRREIESEYAQYYAEQYDLKVQQIEQEYAAKYLLTGDASRQAAISEEADVIARAIGTMSNKSQKLGMLWNILARVDSPMYPNNVKEVVEQPEQWIFYDSSNPIKADDRELAVEQLTLWHDGRYPAGLDKSFVYGEWTATRYILRNTWDKNFGTKTWEWGD